MRADKVYIKVYRASRLCPTPRSVLPLQRKGGRKLIRRSGQIRQKLPTKQLADRSKTPLYQIDLVIKIKPPLKQAQSSAASHPANTNNKTCHTWATLTELFLPIATEYNNSSNKNHSRGQSNKSTWLVRRRLESTVLKRAATNLTIMHYLPCQDHRV